MTSGVDGNCPEVWKKIAIYGIVAVWDISCIIITGRGGL